MLQKAEGVRDGEATLDSQRLSGHSDPRVPARAVRHAVRVVPRVTRLWKFSTTNLRSLSRRRCPHLFRMFTLIVASVCSSAPWGAHHVLVPSDIILTHHFRVVATAGNSPHLWRSKTSRVERRRDSTKKLVAMIEITHGTQPKGCTSPSKIIFYQGQEQGHDRDKPHTPDSKCRP